MFQRDAVYKLLSMQPGEGRTVLLFIAYSLFMGVVISVFYIGTTSLFLLEFGRTERLLAFVASGVFVYGLGWLVQLLRRRGATFVRVNGYLLAFSLLSIGCLLLASSFGHNKWVYFTLILWNRVLIFVHGIVFWATLGRVFNFEQSKRLFGLIGMGEVISSIISYFSVPVLLKFISTDELLLIALLFLVLCVGLMVYISYRFKASLAATSPVKTVTAKKVPEVLNSTAKSYYSLLFILALMPVFGLLYVEFMFTEQSKQIYPDKAVLASFLGIFFGICAVVELVVKVFLYNRLINTYSIRLGIVLLPLSLLVSYTLGAVYGSFYGETSFFFAFLALSRFFMNAIRRAISEPAFQVLFQPIPAAERTLLQSRIEGGPKAIGSILPGLLLLGLTSLGFTLVHMSYVFLAILICWVVVAFRIQAEYRNMLGEAVARSAAHIYQAVTRPILNGTMTVARPGQPATQPLEEVLPLVASEKPDDRIAAAHALAHSKRYYAYKPVLTLLTDEQPAVRVAALGAAGALRKPELWPALLEHLGREPYQEAATAALLASGEAVIPALTKYFNRADLDRTLQVAVVGIVSEIGGAAALRFLRARINHPVQMVRDKVFEGLRRLHHRITVTERPYVLLQLDEQINLLVWVTACRVDLVSYPKSSTLIRALREERQQVIPKIFNLLATLYGDNRFDVISELITQKNDEIKGYLLELLSTTLPDEAKNKVLPLFTSMSMVERLRKCAINYPQQHLSVEGRLHDIINKDFNKISPWLKAVAIRELLHQHQTDPTPILVANAASPHELIAETALYVLRVLNPVRFAELHTFLQGQPESAQYWLATRMANGLPEEMLQVYQQADTEAGESKGREVAHDMVVTSEFQ